MQTEVVLQQEWVLGQSSELLHLLLHRRTPAYELRFLAIATMRFRAYLSPALTMLTAAWSWDWE